MEDINLSKFPALNLVVHHTRALKNGYWLEAIVLAHVYLETQLRMILEFDDFRKDRKTKSEEKVTNLAQRAYKKKIIDKALYEKIEKFNTARNDAVHNLTIGQISYEDLEPMAMESDSLINDLKPFEMAVRSRRNYPD